MNKKHQQAFNKALLKAVKYNKDRQMLLSKDKLKYNVVVPVATVLKSFRPFINMIEKDLKIGKYRVVTKPTTKKQIVKKIKKLK